jgi:hypothetical protein
VQKVKQILLRLLALLAIFSAGRWHRSRIAASLDLGVGTLTEVIATGFAINFFARLIQALQGPAQEPDDEEKSDPKAVIYPIRAAQKKHKK